MAKLLETLFLENLEHYEKGNCFVCRKDCDKDSYCHFECARAFCDDKEKRLKDAWTKARMQWEAQHPKEETKF
jgi:hypothetical protein